MSFAVILYIKKKNRSDNGSLRNQCWGAGARSRDLLQGAGAIKHYSVRAGAGAGKNLKLDSR
jgi:hypothetical protein